MNKYVQIYEDFLSDKMKTPNDDKNHAFQDSLNQFKSKKSNLQSLIMGNIDTDKDITKNIEQIVGGNKYLNAYLNILNNTVTLQKKENKLNVLKDQLKDHNADLINAQSQKVDIDTKKTLISDAKYMVQKTQLEISNTNREITAMKPVIQQLTAALDNMLKADEKMVKTTK